MDPSHNQGIAMQVDDFTTSNICFKSHIIPHNVIHELLFSYMTPLGFLRLARTCRVANDVVRSYIKRTFNVNRLLSRFFQDPVVFRSLQARTGMIFAGSVALQFFDRTYYSGSDLDVYLRSDALVEVTAWLIGEGYVFEPYPKQSTNLQDAIEKIYALDGEHPLYLMRTICGVYTFVKPAASPSIPPLKVQCIVAKASPMNVIFSYHSTCVMNIVSFEKAYSLYPRASIVNHRSLVTCMEPSEGQPAALKKYSDRGFRIETIVGSYDPDFPLGDRYIGDCNCWTLNLDMSGVQTSFAVNEVSTPLTHDPVSATSWSLEVSPGDPHRLVDLVTDNGLHSEFLFYHYTAASWVPLYYARLMVEEQTGIDMRLRSEIPTHSRRFYDKEFTDYVITYYRNHNMRSKLTEELLHKSLFDSHRPFGSVPRVPAYLRSSV
ncbi:hypothetical protein EIP91_010292 [Steccherinum ochraceum]|uniref:F-box domain-containing protein n=1 Tax=Steccherinum ochraceum TaxID=92696 RepID=A0A4V2MX43_9APHY|nr:hypothetical protein EIP91_010292 [Steccherinum ochraceum]